MMSLKVPAGRKNRSEGEKPFWISFSDLMSALMVLFLVVMSVALLAVTNEQSVAGREEAQRAADIAALLEEVKKVAAQFEGVKVLGTTIDLGRRALFEKEGQHTLSQAQRGLIREFTPQLLDKLRNTDAGKKWFKRAVVEGYASRSGTYMLNLNLSLLRSERVLCELLLSDGAGQALSAEDRRLVAQRFFVGGASFNSLRSSADESRRIEFKLEFKTRDEQQRENGAANSAVASLEADMTALDAALDPRERCPIQTP
jgi:outer membrane protein OmpA-like peptidoglycan-associated protein